MNRYVYYSKRIDICILILLYCSLISIEQKGGVKNS